MKRYDEPLEKFAYYVSTKLTTSNIEAPMTTCAAAGDQPKLHANSTTYLNPNNPKKRANKTLQTTSHRTMQKQMIHGLPAKSKETLNFGVRLQIALGSAKGILYLHAEADPPIFHRDIKASNILLDTKLTAKVADFGLSRLAPVMDDEGTVPNHVSTIVKGTPGYLDPEYFLTRKLTDKSDVYSLGVVFLEILTGMKPITHGKNIVREVNLAHQSGTMFSIIDSRMGSYPAECVERLIALALGCCQDKPEQRPSMLDVVRELENILRMMPETELDSSKSTLKYFGESASSSSWGFTTRDPYVSSIVSGSDLVSGVIPTITPR